MNKLRMSIIGTIETCPYLAKQLYGEKGKEEGYVKSKQNFYAWNGSLLHDLFDKYFKEGMTIEQMHEEYDKEIASMTLEFPDGKRDYFIKTSHEQIDYFADKLSLSTPIATEIKFDDLYIDGFDMPWSGTIDRIEGNLEEGYLELQDYKTGSHTKYTKQELSNNVQAYVYYHACIKMYGIAPTSFTFIFPRDKRSKTIVYTNEYLKRAKSRIKRSINDIEQGLFLPEGRKGDFFCKKFCELYSECPKFEKKKGWDLCL